MLATVDRARPTRSARSLLGEAELVDELPVGARRLDRVEVLALEVLDERELELLAVGELADDRRDPLEAGQPGGPDASLAGDELVAVERLGHEDRLEDAVLADARGERRERRRRRSRCRGWRGFALIRSSGISIDAGGLRRALRDEGGEAATEALRPLRRPPITRPSPRRSRVGVDGAVVARVDAAGPRRPSAVRRAAPSPADSAELVGQGPVGLGARRVGRVERDRQAVARRLGEPDAARDDGLEDRDRRGGARTSAATSRRQVRPGVEHRQDDAVDGRAAG